MAGPLHLLLGGRLGTFAAPAYEGSQRAKRVIYRLGVRKNFSDLGFQDYDVRSMPVPACVLSSDSAGKVVFRQDIRFWLSLFLLHNLYVRVWSQTGRLLSGRFERDRCAPRPAVSGCG
jgi:hypothetical protein